MNKSNVQATIQITGRKDHVEKMLRLLDAIDMCAAGCTRSFKIWYDGDGAARLKIRFPDGKYLVERDKDSWNLLDKEPITFDFD